MLRKGPGATPLSLETDMANPNPLMAKSSGTEPADAAVQSALRTLDAEGGGIAALSAALQSDLRAPFVAAADLIRNAKGRLIVTGLGKSGHIGRKIAATFASTGTPGVLRPCRRSQPWRPRHDHGRGCHPGAVLVRRAAGDEEPDQLRRAVPDCRDRDDVGAGILARQGGRRRADAAQGARGLPAQSRPHHLLADDAGARRCAGDRAAGRPRLYVDRFQRAASGRQARRAAEIYRRPHAFRRRGAAEAARHQNVRRAGRDDVEGLWLRRHRR